MTLNNVFNSFPFELQLKNNVTKEEQRPMPIKKCKDKLEIKIIILVRSQIIHIHDRVLGYSIKVVE